jgi:uncharacterized membrane protein YfcA
MWSRENVVLYPLLCTAAGFGSGCFGIGGGTITGPLMLALDMHPQVVAATASFMILFTSSLTTTQFLIVGSLNLQYGAWCRPLTFPSVCACCLYSLTRFQGFVSWVFALVSLASGTSLPFYTTIARQHCHRMSGASLGPSADGGSNPLLFW